MIALNEDAKVIVLSNYAGNSLESIINEVTNKLINKGYAQEKLVQVALLQVMKSKI